MTKAVSNCRICGKKSLVNSLYLCKRCNSSKEAIELHKEEAEEKRHEIELKEKHTKELLEQSITPIENSTKEDTKEEKKKEEHIPEKKE